MAIPRLYTDFAEWWPVFSAPADYAEEAEVYHKALLDACQPPLNNLLELGSGGGSNASFLKKHFNLTLVDLSPGMLQVSQRINPEVKHLLGDMRTVRLDRTFDAVFIHDAISYLLDETDLRRAFETAYFHCKEGGVALFAPDHTTENFLPDTLHGGHDSADGRGLRYLEWTWDPDPTDQTYVCDFVYLFHFPDGRIKSAYDRHTLGCFPQATWLQLLREVGFEPAVIPFEHSQIKPGSCEFFIGKKTT
jgi:SAM-dependent methyltransferase